MANVPSVDGIADRLFSAIEAGEIEGVAELYDDDVRVWRNTDGVTEDKAANLAVLAWMVRRTTRRSYQEVRRLTTPTGFVQQHVLHLGFPDGRTAEIPACLVVTVDAGRIVAIEEYLDSAHVESAFGV